MWSRRQRKKRKRQKSESVSEESTGQPSDQSDHSDQSINLASTCNALGEANDVLYGKPDQPTKVLEVLEDADIGDCGTHDVEDGEGIKTSTPMPKTVKKVEMNNDVKLDLILERLKKLDEIDAISKKLDTLEHRLTGFESRIKNVENKSNVLERSVKFLSEQYESVKASKDTSEFESTIINTHQNIVKEMNEFIAQVTTERDSLRDTVVDLQCRSMKNNLIFTGLEGEYPEEGIEEKLRDFLFYELNIGQKIEFGNVHRFGRYIRGKSRPVVARFLYYNDLQLVKSRAYMLRGSSFGIREQFPASVEDKRKDLYPLMKKLRDDKQNAKLVRDKLYVRGKLQNAEDITALFAKYEARTRSDALSREQHQSTDEPQPSGASRLHFDSYAAAVSQQRQDDCRSDMEIETYNQPQPQHMRARNDNRKSGSAAQGMGPRQVSYAPPQDDIVRAAGAGSGSSQQQRNASGQQHTGVKVAVRADIHNTQNQVRDGPAGVRTDNRYDILRGVPQSPAPQEQRGVFPCR